MTTLIDTLRKLNELDGELFKMRTQLTEAPAALAEAEAALAALQAEQEQILDSQKKTHASSEALNVEIRSKEEEVNKLKGQLNIVKTNAEYTATTVQIENVEKEMSDIETQVLEGMESVDEMNTKLKALDGAIKDQNAQIAVQREKIDKELSIVREREKSETVSRDEFAKQIDPESLDVYERVLRKLGKGAMAPAADFACGVCRMRLPPQVFNTVLLAEEIIACPNCGRVLFKDDAA